MNIIANRVVWEQCDPLHHEGSGADLRLSSELGYDYTGH